jgi:SAM-dependent methyltransferase
MSQGSNTDADRAPADGGSPARLGHDHRSFVGPEALYDVFAAMQFNLLTSLGLREHHRLLDVGCGSLRAGRLFICYLAPGHYAGVEPEAWLVTEGVRSQLGADMLRLKQPRFEHRDDFRLTALGQEFDFLLAQSIFSHTTQAQIQTCFAEAKKVLAPDGVFAATFFEGSEDYRGRQWTLHAAFTFRSLQRWAEEAGLRATRIDWPHPDGQRWFLLQHPAAAPSALASAGDGLRLRQELEICRERLQRLEQSRYVRFGKRIHRLLESWRFRLDRLRRG